MNKESSKKKTIRLIIGISILVFLFIAAIFGLAKMVMPYTIIFVSIAMALSIPFFFLIPKKGKRQNKSESYKYKVKKTKSRYTSPEDKVVDYVNGKKEFKDLSNDAQVEYFEEWEDD